MSNIRVTSIAIEWIPKVITRREQEYDAIIRVYVERYKEYFWGWLSTTRKELYYGRRQLGSDDTIVFEPASSRTQGVDRVVDEGLLKRVLLGYNEFCGLEEPLTETIWGSLLRSGPLQARLRHAIEYIFLNQQERQEAIRRADNWLRW